MQVVHYKLQIALGLMKAERATEDVEEARDFSCTGFSNRASEIPGAVRLCESHTCKNHPTECSKLQNTTMQT